MSKLVLFLCIGVSLCSAGAAPNLNVALMESTVKIVGPSSERTNAVSSGTGFIVGKPMPNNPTQAWFTLITAHHVFNNIMGDTVTMCFRQPLNADEWKRIELPVQIRDGTKQLWYKHPDADVAAIFVSLPREAHPHQLISTKRLLSDEKMKEWEINPGSELLCLGYPMGVEANSEGFPILRSGKVASYPLFPTKKTKGFLFDFAVFGGNSGGPVYIYDPSPTHGGAIAVGFTAQGIVGIVVQGGLSNTIGRVIPAPFIQELIDLMPEPVPPPANLPGPITAPPLRLP